jgi:hypothetical protein
MKMNIILALSMTVAANAFGSDIYFSSTPEKMSTGSYTCQKSVNDQTPIGSFFVRKDGSSKKVQIFGAKTAENGSGVEGCYIADFKWLNTNTKVSGAYCCPFGSN